MATYLVLAALLAVAAAVALAWPLRRSRAAFAAIVVAVPVLALCLYQFVGTPGALDPAQRKAPETLDEAIAQLQADLQRDPRQVDGWRLLGRALQQQDRAQEARDAFARAVALAPDDLPAQIEYAESRSRADPQRRFDATALQALERVLKLDPEQERARLFLGIAYRQHGRDAEAAAVWEPLLAALSTEAAGGLREQIDEARRAAGLDPLPAPAQDATAPGLRVRVSLDAEFAARVRLDPEAVVFVIARAPGGPPMPAAVQRRRVAELPLDLTLTDRDSPMPTQPLSALQEVEVLARMSASGSATPAEGDLASVPVRVALPAEGAVDLVLGAAR
ncbi:tetratricopeptide repeat protein [Luteimonas sp. Y-2-2-4F]|nr:tetratricopeptide repeat protein [Luteimonas sp. Y-2-2-4F]MCD9033143.1 tetratricopeptide repeat protein [Luteimonas sp. Y-2-2-4F]